MKKSWYRAPVVATLLASVLAWSVAACGTPQSDPGPTNTVTVYAASSLTETFTELGARFEAAHPGVSVRFSFGGSADLASQIQSGAPADVFASADIRSMARVTEDGLEGTVPMDFASNTLAIVTPPDNPAAITSLADLARKDVALVLCAPEVPCGDAARRIEMATGLDLEPVSEEQNVKDVLAKVTVGEADAGLVYITDALGAGDAVQRVAFSESSLAVNTYPITRIKTARNPELANEFIDYVLGTSGQDVLAAAGFAPAPR